MTLNSLGLFVGTGACNARCAHCAGVPHRKFAPKKDGEVDLALFERTLVECHEKGARSLSISSSGEPTLSPMSVTKVLQLVKHLSKCNLKYDRIHLYSNGIRIGSDQKFCLGYLPYWKSLGLDTIYLTIHSIYEGENAMVYGTPTYPLLDRVISRIHSARLLVRANLVLGRQTIPSPETFFETVECLLRLGTDSITSWKVRNDKDEVDLVNGLSPQEVQEISDWIQKKGFPNVRLIQVSTHNDSYSSSTKLTLFPDGTLSSSWCRI
jgi:MoaA/NifB/PqqE/SkfB family radical SAM enzyme